MILACLPALLTWTWGMMSLSITSRLAQLGGHASVPKVGPPCFNFGHSPNLELGQHKGHHKIRLNIFRL